jgi:hypothetical protein
MQFGSNDPKCIFTSELITRTPWSTVIIHICPVIVSAVSNLILLTSRIKLLTLSLYLYYSPFHSENQKSSCHLPSQRVHSFGSHVSARDGICCERICRIRIQKQGAGTAKYRLLQLGRDPLSESNSSFVCSRY